MTDLVVQGEFCQYILSRTDGFRHDISLSNIADDYSPGIDPPYAVHGGLFREEAIMLLRRFYVQQNDKAPDPREKKNRVLNEEILPVISDGFNSGAK
ncbi:tRNA(adenine34) deaminase [Xylographa trunciseda]|nr:tRNA(adenine34) deaminase [Xylographa trunciseda]